MRRDLRAAAVASLFVLAPSGIVACGDEDAGGGPSGGFDDQAPESDFSDDELDPTSTTGVGQVVEGSDTEAGDPSDEIGNVEGEGDVNDLESDDG